MNGTPVQGGDGGNILPSSDMLICMWTLYHGECAIAHDRHIQLLTVLPHTTFQSHRVSRHTIFTYRLTWWVYKGTVIYWPSCTMTESRSFIHIMRNVW